MNWTCTYKCARNIIDVKIDFLSQLLDWNWEINDISFQKIVVSSHAAVVPTTTVHENERGSEIFTSLLTVCADILQKLSKQRDRRTAPDLF